MNLKLHKSMLVLALGASIALAACGSSGSSKVGTGGGGTTTSTPAKSTGGGSVTTASGGAAVVTTATNAKFGSILVDSKGMTLYTLTSAGKAVPCTGQCPTFWPPLLLPAGTTSATGAAGVSGLGTVSATGGTQVTQNGLPLYHFGGDAAAGDANGDGISSFGGTWHVVKASGAPASGSGATVTTMPSGATTSTGGYGY